MKAPICAALLTGSMVLTGCGREPPQPDAGKGKDAAAAFSTVKPERKTLERTIEQPARVEAFEETPLVVRMAGHVQRSTLTSAAR